MSDQLSSPYLSSDEERAKKISDKIPHVDSLDVQVINV